MGKYVVHFNQNFVFHHVLSAETSLYLVSIG